MPIPVPFTGGCACGAIRYECSAEPLLMWNCHCRDCQRGTGGPYYPNVIVPAVAFAFTTREPTYYAVPGTTGSHVHRGFCPTCGSPVGSKADHVPELRGIYAASLDDPSWYQPLADVWTVSAQNWDYLNPALPKIAHQPTEEDMQALMSTRG